MATIFDTTLSNVFPCMKMYEFTLKFHRNDVISLQSIHSEKGNIR